MTGPAPLLDVIAVSTEGYVLHLAFENGERRRFDMRPYLSKRPFDRLQDPAAFARAYVENGTVTWPGGLDFAPETLYAGSVPAA